LNTLAYTTLKTKN